MCYAYPGDAMTVYLDQVWLLNGLVDYLLLRASGRLLGMPLRRMQLALAGAAGGIYAALSLLPGMAFLQSGLCRVLAAALLCLCAFWSPKGLLRQTIVLFLLAAAFSGITLLLTQCFSAPGALIGGTVYYPLSLGVLVLTAGGACGLISWGLMRLVQHGGGVAEVQAKLGKEAVTFTALYDTGNTLRDPISGCPVLVADWTLLGQLLPNTSVTREELERPEQLLLRLKRTRPELHPRLIPYKTVGTAQGMLLALRPGCIKVEGREESLLMAFSPVEVSDGGGYRALLGGIR